jgi:dsDNA-specific endonuclease/ATPase MutS2
LYQLKIHEEGESNALWIANKMGISKEILEKAKMYMSHKEYDLRLVAKSYVRSEKEIEISHPQEVLERGDKVILLEYGEEGIIYQTKTDYQPLLVWYHNEAIEVEEKRVKLCIKAKELYPTGYDLDTLFSSFKERKEARDIARGSKKALRRIAKERKKG